MKGLNKLMKLRNKQMSQHAFAKLVPTDQVRSAFLFSTTVLDRQQDILLFSYARNNIAEVS